VSLLCTNQAFLTRFRKKIYFDGFLPPSKIETRLDRLRVNTSQLRIYQSQNRVPCRASFDCSQDAPELFERRYIRPGHKSLPAPSFLVPAILEALQESPSYRDLTLVVPDEADSYCAAHTKQYGGIVLTGDSDLIVHDLGLNGAVMLFDTIKAVTKSGERSVTGEVYRPSEMVKRLELPLPYGISALAFEISKDEYGTFPKLLQQAKSLTAIKKHDAEYNKFMEQYKSEIFEFASEITSFMEPPSILVRLDPRISEYILQFPAISRLSGRSVLEAELSTIPHIFLPFLIDSYEQRNAWEVSAGIRQLAYGLMNLIVPESQRISCVVEHKRQQANGGGRELMLPQLTQISGSCTNVLALLAHIDEALPKKSQSSFWIAIAIEQDLSWSRANDKQSVTDAVLEQISRLAMPSNSETKLTWDIVRYSAQIHGSYYSFRVLKQITSVVVSYGSELSLPAPLLELHRQLENLPKLRDLKDLSSISSVLPLIISVSGYSNPGRTDVSVAQGKSIVQPPFLENNIEVMKKLRLEARRQRRSEKMKSPSKSKADKASTNAFAVLDIE
jgi:hypothetical protein